MALVSWVAPGSGSEAHRRRGGADQHLQAQAGALVLARPQVRPILPAPARQERTVDDVHAPVGDLLDGRQHRPQDPGDDPGDHRDRPRGRRL